MTLPDDVYHFVRLEPEEETALFRRYKDLGDLEARDDIVRRHIRHGLCVARRILGSNPTDEQLLSIVGAALMEAITGNFDPSKSRFCTYAMFLVRRHCLDSHDLRLPVSMSPRAFTRALGKGDKMAVLRLYPDGTFDADITQHLDAEAWAPGVVAALVDSLTSYTDSDSLDLPDITEKMMQGLESLTGREQLVLRKKYWDGWVFDQIGHELGCSREWARRIHDGAIHKMRKHLRRELALPLPV